MQSGDEILLRLYRRHFNDGDAALARLDQYLADFHIPFDLKKQVRELPFPSPDLVIPSMIYYFVPGSRRGTDRPICRDPRSFLNTSDGFGLNLGCPVRLLRAFDAISRLSLGDQRELRDELEHAPGHLSAVEEALWLTGWSFPLRRGPQFSGIQGNVDWQLSSTEGPLFLEAKFRQSDWQRLVDGQTSPEIVDGFLSSAIHKFPNPSEIPNAVHVVGITTFANLDDELLNRIGCQLEAHPQIHAVVVRSLLQMTHVISLSVPIRDRVIDLLVPPSVLDYPLNYGVIFNRAHHENRIANRQPIEASRRPATLACWPVEPTGTLPYKLPNPGAFRIEIPTRGDENEPQFKVVSRSH